MSPELRSLYALLKSQLLVRLHRLRHLAVPQGSVEQLPRCRPGNEAELRNDHAAGAGAGGVRKSAAAHTSASGYPPAHPGEQRAVWSAYWTAAAGGKSEAAAGKVRIVVMFPQDEQTLGYIK